MNRDSDRDASTDLTSGSRSGEFRWPLRVYYEDTDSGGVIYHAGYLRFMERARTEWLRSLGLNQQRLRDEEGLVFIVTAMEIEFLSPGRLDDELEATVRLTQTRPASMAMEQRVLRVSDQLLLCTARVRAACVELDGFRPRRLPAQFLSETNA